MRQDVKKKKKDDYDKDFRGGGRVEVGVIINWPAGAPAGM